MAKTLEFPDMLRLIDERSVAFRAALAAAPSLAVQVQTCPEWALLDLVKHLGASQRRWAATVAAGPADSPAADASEYAAAAPGERAALLAWSAESTQLLLSALQASGPDRGCWTRRGGSQSPQTSGALARHQVQHVMVHTYDAQITLGAPPPLPGAAALDGVDEFLSTSARGRTRGRTSRVWSTTTPPRADLGASRSRPWAHGPPGSPAPPR